VNDTVTDSAPPQPTRLPRLWPGWLIVVIQLIVLVISVSPTIDNFTRFMCMFMGPLACSMLFLGWLLLASRMAVGRRLLLALTPIVLSLIVSLIVHPSMKIALLFYGAPMFMLATVLVLQLTRHRQKPAAGNMGVVLACLLIAAAFTPSRVDGWTGDYLPEFAWRWSPRPEDKLLQAAELSAAEPDESWQAGTAAWPSFRGPTLNSQATIQTATPLDWQKAAPKVTWQIPIGPGWSSFAFASGRLFTQEQRGDEEWITCYDAGTGGYIWHHADRTRFTEAVSGAGPRATPTLAGEFLYAMGASGHVTCLNAQTGSMVWQRNLSSEFNARVPMWGFSSSPLVIDNLVIVYAGAPNDAGLMAFDGSTGEVVWKVGLNTEDPSGAEAMNYSSAQPITIDGKRMIVFGDRTELMALEPADGSVLWRYTPTDWAGPAMCQPQQIGPNALIVALGDGDGVARLEIAREDGEWVIEEKWSSRKLRPSFNDFVYHDGHLYGFNQHIFTSIDAETGELNWRGGRYGFGQVLLLPELAQLIVAAEDGRVLLLAARPDELIELGQLEPLDGKTWNHPIVANDQLFHRNAQAAFALPLN